MQKIEFCEFCEILAKKPELILYEDELIYIFKDVD
jgi:diadenosine tetraphosphate (Ap4A) HIT family hydrolase